MTTMNLRKKVEALIRAHKAVIDELKRLYPVDREVRVFLMHNQVNPSHGRVIGHEGGRDARVVVRLESRKREVRRVPAENIL